MDIDLKGIWIPKDIFIMQDLSWSEKILLIQINHFDNDNVGCYASNEYLANMLMVSEGALANMITKLVNKGYVIKRGFDGRKRYISLSKELIKILRQSSQNYEGRVNEIVKAEPIKILKQSSQKSEHNNIDNNIVNKKIKNNSFEYPKNASFILIQNIESFFNYRSDIKKPYKSESSKFAKINMFIKQAEDYGENAVIESIQTAIANGWQGTFINPDYLKSKNLVKDDKGNYANTKEGRKLFVSNIRNRASDLLFENE